MDSDISSTSESSEPRSELQRKSRLRVGGVPEHFNLPWHIAIGNNAFQSIGLDVEFIEYPGGTGAMTKAMTDGELDIALLLFEGAVTNILRGHDNRLVKVYVDSPLIWGIHVAGDSDIQHVEEIQNKVYAISRAGSGSHLIAIVDAAERGWPTEAMKFSKVGNLEGAREKLANGKVDVFLWERFMTQPLVDSGEFRRVGERVVPWPAFVVSVTKSALRDQATAIKSMLEIVSRVCQELKEDPQAAQLIAERFDLNFDDAAQWLQLVQWSDAGFERPDDTINTIIGYLKQVGIVEESNAGPADVWYPL